MRTFTITIIALLLILPLASAATTINLKTLPGRDVFISVRSEDSSTQLTTPKKFLSDIDGNIQYIYEGTTSPFEVRVIVKQFGVQVYWEEFGPYAVGGTIQLPNLLPDDFVGIAGENSSSGEDTTISNSTVNNSTTNNSTTNSGVNSSTNSTVSNVSFWDTFDIEEMLSSDTAIIVYYILGAIVLIGIVIIVIRVIIRKVKNKQRTQYGMEPVKLDTKYRPSPSGDKYLDNIEKEIENVDRQIEQYKKRSRLDDAQKRLEEKKKVLERIKRGENTDSSSSPSSSSYSAPSNFSRPSSPQRFSRPSPQKSFSSSDTSASSNPSNPPAQPSNSSNPLSSSREDRQNKYKKRFY